MRPFRVAGDAWIYRVGVIGFLAIVVLGPVGLIIYQSFLTGAFFFPQTAIGLDAYRYVFTDDDFYRSLLNTLIFSAGIVVISVPLGSFFSFLTTRTDIVGKSFLEILILVPIFISSIVLAFGYTVSIGPTGVLSLIVRNLTGGVPWSLYSLQGMTILAGLSHVPYVYLYVSAAMRNLPTDLEEAARVSGASVWQVLRDVTLPIVLPSIIFAAALNVLLGFETFGIPLILGEPARITVLTTYIYKVTTQFGTPSYHIMAVVAVMLMLITLPLVWLQRRLLRNSKKYAVVGGKGARVAPLRLGRAGQVIALSTVGLWLFVTVFLPVGGIILRAFVSAWGENVSLIESFTLDNFRQLFTVSTLARGLMNTVLLSVVGGAIAVVVYLLIALAGHRNTGSSNTLLDYIVLLPRALPGLVVGLAFFWVFLFVPFLTFLRLTPISLFIAYLVVGLSYGLRLLQGTLLQVSSELEEAARTTGAPIGVAWRDIVVPLIRPGLAGAWALIMVIFLREYATGVYLMGAGTEVVGSLMVSFYQTGSINIVATLAFVSLLLTALALLFAIRLGARINE
jgi:iron(III) transport system permease protein